MAEDGANESAGSGERSPAVPDGSAAPDAPDGSVADDPPLDGPNVEVPSVDVPSVDVPGVDAPGVDGPVVDGDDTGHPGDPAESLEAVDVGDSEIAALFVRHVLVWNAVLLAITLGALLIAFRSDWTTGSRLIAVGIALSLYGAYRWPDPDPNGPEDGVGDDGDFLDGDLDDGDLVDADEGPG